MSLRLTLRLLTGQPDEMAELARVLAGAPTYAERATGYPPGPADAQSLFSMLPPGLDYAAKATCALMLAGAVEGGVESGVDGRVYGDASVQSPPLMVGCADVLRGWPDRQTALIGLLLLDEAHQRRGLGSAAYRLLEERIRLWPEIERARAAVVRTNAEVLPFWERLGFAETGEVKPYRYDQLISEVIIVGRPLAVGPRE